MAQEKPAVVKQRLLRSACTSGHRQHREQCSEVGVGHPGPEPLPSLTKWTTYKLVLCRAVCWILSLFPWVSFPNSRAAGEAVIASSRHLPRHPVHPQLCQQQWHCHPPHRDSSTSGWEPSAADPGPVWAVCSALRSAPWD